MASYVLSILGNDRSGLVEALAGVISRRGGNWDRSHMTQLAGKFAGVLLVTISEGEVDAFLADLAPLEIEGLFDISVEAAESDDSGEYPQVAVDLVGNDHPGIVHELSHLLALHKVSIDDLKTWTNAAPMAGGRLFHAKALLRLPPGLSSDQLLQELEALAADLMVDIHLIQGVEDADTLGF